jgi:hypothetical protein
VPLSLVVVCEAPADGQTGCDLADRVFCDKVSWIEEEMLPHLREWRGLAPQDPCLLWRNVPDLAKARRVRAHGHFDGEPGALQAAVARKALLLVFTISPCPDGIVLLRDDDGRPEVRRGFDQARTAARLPLPVVIGVASTKRECWVLAGFEPQNQHEEAALEKLRQELGFDPRDKAELLTAKHDADQRSAKRVLNALTEGDWQREAGCWRKTDLGVLAARGKHSGLTHYLDEVHKHLVPLFDRRSVPD